MASKSNSKLAHRTVEKGMIEIVKDIIGKEANEITKCSVLRPPDTVDANFALGMKFSTLPDVIKENCPTMFQILLGIIKTDRQARECTNRWLEHKSFVSIVNIWSIYTLT